MSEDWGGVAIGQNVPVGDIIIGDNLLTIHPDGTVDGRIADTGEAAHAFVEWARTYLGVAFREARAEAWDEGFDAGEECGRMPSMYPARDNPYRT